MAHRLCIHMHTFHSVIIVGNHQAADTAAATDVSSSQIALVSDQWHTIWSRVSQQQEVVNVTVSLWQRYQMQLAGLRYVLTQIREDIRTNCGHDVVSLPMQHAQMTRLQVTVDCLVISVISSWLLCQI